MGEDVAEAVKIIGDLLAFTRIESDNMLNRKFIYCWEREAMKFLSKYMHGHAVNLWSHDATIEFEKGRWDA